MKELGKLIVNGRGDERPVYQPQSQQPVYETPLPMGTDFGYWSNRFIARQKQYKETAEVQRDHIVISFPDTTILNFIGDAHVGSPDTHYDRLVKEVETIVHTPNSYAILGGDLIDGMFFSQAQHEQIEPIPEQFAYMQALVEYLGKNGKLLAGWSGDHDMWIKKMGLSAYSEFSKKTGAYLMQGLGYLTAKLPDSEYYFSVAHQLPGHSMYSKTHPQKRAYKFGGASGSDVVVSFHNHQKELTMSWEKSFGGEVHPVYSIACGAYKATDDYARKKGFAQQKPQEMYGAAVRIERGSKKITTFSDILEANR
jgi:hypothetical protein